jgi:hypothetical protein
MGENRLGAAAAAGGYCWLLLLAAAAAGCCCCCCAPRARTTELLRVVTHRCACAAQAPGSLRMQAATRPVLASPPTAVLLGCAEALQLAPHTRTTITPSPRDACPRSGRSSAPRTHPGTWGGQGRTTRWRPWRARWSVGDKQGGRGNRRETHDRDQSAPEQQQRALRADRVAHKCHSRCARPLPASRHQRRVPEQEIDISMASAPPPAPGHAGAARQLPARPGA